MATRQQLDRQFHREIEARQEAVNRLRERTRTAEDRCYASSTVYGSSFLNSGLEAITKEIATKLSHITRGWASDKAAAVMAIKDCDPAVLALITAKGILDVLGQRKLEKPTYAAVTYHIGNLVFDQILLDQFCAKHKDLFESAHSSIHAHKGYSYRVQRYRAAMRKHGIQAARWPTSVKVLVGGWLMDRLAAATGWITTRVVRSSAHKSQTLVVYQPEFLRIKEALM
jgi:hypothetical protein